MIVLTGTGRGFVRNWSKKCSINFFSCTVLFCSVLLCKIKRTFFYKKGIFFVSTAMICKFTCGSLSEAE